MERFSIQGTPDGQFRVVLVILRQQFSSPGHLSAKGLTVFSIYRPRPFESLAKIVEDCFHESHLIDNRQPANALQQLRVIHEESPDEGRVLPEGISTGFIVPGHHGNASSHLSTHPQAHLYLFLPAS
jgi:hypothetical protein